MVHNNKDTEELQKQLAEVQQQLADLTNNLSVNIVTDIYVDEDGKLHKVKDGADSVIPFKGSDTNSYGVLPFMNFGTGTSGNITCGSDGLAIFCGYARSGIAADYNVTVTYTCYVNDVVAKTFSLTDNIYRGSLGKATGVQIPVKKGDVLKITSSSSSALYGECAFIIYPAS